MFNISIQHTYLFVLNSTTKLYNKITVKTNKEQKLIQENPDMQRKHAQETPYECWVTFLCEVHTFYKHLCSTDGTSATYNSN